MKYSITINQKAAIDLGLNVDIIDLAILDCIISFMHTDRCRKIDIFGKVYYWISNAFIIQEMPLIGITTDRGISKRLDKLIDCELLERCPHNQSLKATYYCAGKKYDEYIFGTWNESSNLTWNESSDNNNTINNKKENKDNKLSLSKKSQKTFDVRADLSYVDDKFSEIWNEWLDYKDEIKKQYKTQRGAKMQYLSLLKYADNDIILANAIVNRSIEQSWDGLFAITDKQKSLFLSSNNPYQPSLPTVDETPDGLVNEKGEVWSKQLQKWLK